MPTRRSGRCKPVKSQLFASNRNVQMHTLGCPVRRTICGGEFGRGGENGDDSYRMTSSKNDDLTESNGHKIDIKSATSCGVVGQTLHRHRNYLSQTETNARNVGALLHALRCHSSAQRVKNGLRNCADAWD